MKGEKDGRRSNPEQPRNFSVSRERSDVAVPP